MITSLQRVSDNPTFSHASLSLVSSPMDFVIDFFKFFLNYSCSVLFIEFFKF